MAEIDISERVVLEGVPRIHFYAGGPRCPEDICSASVVRAVLEYLGEDIGCDHYQPAGRKWGLRCGYSYFLGVMGLAWQMAWAPGWDDSSLTTRYFPGSLEEPYLRAFAAVGYPAEFISPEAGEQEMRSRIIASIRDQRRPVIGFGIVGPPEPIIITGFDEGGDVLTGWSFFQNIPPFNAGLDYEPGHLGYFRKRGWFNETSGLILVGNPRPAPDQARVFLDSLRRGLAVLDLAEINGAPAGAPAYDAWAAALLCDADFDGKDDDALRRLHDVHNMAVGQIAEYRWYGSVWLANTYPRAHYDLAEDLLKASGCFAAEHALMWDLWDLTGGNGHPDAWRKFADPAVRRKMIPVIQASRDRYIEGARHIRHALAKIK